MKLSQLSNYYCERLNKSWQVFLLSFRSSATIWDFSFKLIFNSNGQSTQYNIPQEMGN